MGLIKAALGSLGGELADQWKEFFYCDALEADVLMAKGQKRVNGNRSSNTSGSDNIISSGSAIAVNEGQFMIIVEQGEIVEFCGEPGEFTWDSSTEPSLFAGNLGTSIMETFKNFGRRFTYGGDTGKDQRVYYFNTKEIIGNRYGTASPVPFRVVDEHANIDIDIAIRCNGEYSYKLTDPILFYKNVCGNDPDDFRRSEIDSQLKSELLTALQPTFAQISAQGVRYSQLPAHTTEIAEILNQQLSDKWSNLRGISIVSFGINSVKAPEEDEQMIKDLQRAAASKDPSMAAARLVDAQAEAMQAAANNQNAGAFAAFAGMNMANSAGGANANELFAAAQQQAAQQQASQQQAAQQQAGGSQPASQQQQEQAAQQPSASAASEAAAPAGGASAASGSWTCACGSVNTDMFCPECGKPRPEQPKCSKCGYEPEGAAPKFCPKCGNSFGG